MQTMKDRLSQKIFEIPNEAREFFVTLEFEHKVSLIACAAATFIVRKLEIEEHEHPLIWFGQDRIEDITLQTQLINEGKVTYSSDVDTLVFLLFSCEQTIEKFDEFVHDMNLSVDRDELTFLRDNMNTAHGILTGTLASVLLQESL